MVAQAYGQALNTLFKTLCTDPRLTDYELLLQNLRDLRAGRAIQAPIYDFKHSKRVGYRQVDVPESRIVVVEGIYALSPQLRCVVV